MGHDALNGEISRLIDRDGWNLGIIAPKNDKQGFAPADVPAQNGCAGLRRLWYPLQRHFAEGGYDDPDDEGPRN